MEDHNHLNALQFTPMGSELDGSTIDNPYFVDGITSQMSSVMDTNQFYGQQLTQGYDGYLACGIPELQTQMLYSNLLVEPSILVADPSTYIESEQQVPQSYVGFLSESGVSEHQNQMELNYPVEAYGFMPANTSSYMKGHKKEKLNEEANHNLRFQSSQVTPAPRYPSRTRSEASKQRALETDRLRKSKVSKSLKALQELVPHAMEGGQGCAIDHIIDYIKYLQLQMKEHAHYLLHDEIPHSPLEEMMGKLLEDNWSCAMQLLQSRGLILMPMSLAEKLS